jgi:hypothetical protein
MPFLRLGRLKNAIFKARKAKKCHFLVPERQISFGKSQKTPKIPLETLWKGSFPFGKAPKPPKSLWKPFGKPQTTPQTLWKAQNYPQTIVGGLFQAGRPL